MLDRVAVCSSLFVIVCRLSRVFVVCGLMVVAFFVVWRSMFVAWLLVVLRCVLLVIGCLSLVVCRLPFVVCCLFDPRCVLLVARCLLLGVVSCFAFVGCCCLLFVACW